MLYEVITVPAPPVQLPPADVLAARVAGLIPQTTWSAPALAVAGILTVIVISSDTDGQGPAPSGSGTFQVRVTNEPTSPAEGV